MVVILTAPCTLSTAATAANPNQLLQHHAVVQLVYPGIVLVGYEPSAICTHGMGYLSTLLELRNIHVDPYRIKFMCICAKTGVIPQGTHSVPKWSPTVVFFESMAVSMLSPRSSLVVDLPRFAASPLENDYASTPIGEIIATSDRMHDNRAFHQEVARFAFHNWGLAIP